MCAQLLSHVQLFATPWTRALCPQDFPGKNTGKNTAISYSRGSSWPRDDGTGSPTLQVDALLSELPGKPLIK